MAPNPVKFSRFVYWPCNQVIWATWRIRNSSTPICSGRAPRLPAFTKHPSSSIYIIMEWCGTVGPEGPLVFLTGGFGTFVSERLKLCQRDIQVLVYSAIAGGFGGFFGSPIIGAIGAFGTCSSGRWISIAT